MLDMTCNRLNVSVSSHNTYGSEDIDRMRLFHSKTYIIIININTIDDSTQMISTDS